MPIAQYDPPGNLTDFDDNGRAQWNSFLSGTVDRVRAGNPTHTNDSPRAGFFNLTSTDTGADASDKTVTWIAFPRKVAVHSVSDHQRWARADASRDVQDEYCEWNITRNAANKITRVTFTCEGPEYWEVLAQQQRQKVLELYRQYVDPAVAEGDLFDSSGQYIQRNKYNTDTTRGVMHLVQANNTLSAEIELAGAATIVRVIDGRQLSGEQELIACSEYGDPDRNSDPHIGGVVNSIAAQRADIALANPVGLYFNDLSTSGWTTPDGTDPKTYWTYTRGDATHPVRAVYEVPDARGYVVGDITINGAPITFGAQIVDFISMKLTAVAWNFGHSAATPMTNCVGPAPTLSPGIAEVRAGAGTVTASR